MKLVVAWTLSFACLATVCAAEDIYKWTDEQGQIHFSNRSASTKEPADGDAGRSGDGWEGQLEPRRGTEVFQQKVDAAINSLEAKLTHAKRARSRVQADLEATQLDIARVQNDRARFEEVSALKAREVTEQDEIRRLDFEASELREKIAQVRAMRAIGRDSQVETN